MTNLVACKFAIEDGQVFEGFYNPDNKYWNGWLNPIVTKEVADAIASMMRSELEAWSPSDIEEQREELEESLTWILNSPREDGLYYFGSCWIWSEVKEG